MQSERVDYRVSRGMYLDPERGLIPVVIHLNTDTERWFITSHRRLFAVEPGWALVERAGDLYPLRLMNTEELAAMVLEARR